MAEKPKGFAGILQDPNFITGVSILAANSDPRRHWSEGYKDASGYLSSMERSALNRAEMELRKQKFEQEQQAMEAQRAAQERLRTSLAGAKTPQEVGMALMTQGTGGQISTGAQLYGARGPSKTTPIQNYEYYAAQEKAAGREPQTFLEFSQQQRASGGDDYYQFIPTAEGYVRANLRTGEYELLGESPLPISAPTSQAKITEARELGKAAGKEAGEAEGALPQTKTTLDRIGGFIKYAEENPELIDEQLGFRRFVPSVTGEARDTQRMMDFVDKQRAMQAVELFRGTGPMTEQEFAAGMEAAANLDRNQTYDSYLKSVKEWYSHVQKMYEKYGERAQPYLQFLGQEPTTQMAPTQQPAPAGQTPAVVDFGDLPES